MTLIMPRLPTELVRNILYKYDGLEHSCVKHLVSNVTFKRNRIRCDNEIKTQCPPDCTGEHIGWSSSCYDHDGINHHQMIVNMYKHTICPMDICIIRDQITTISRRLSNIERLNFDLLTKRHKLEQQRMGLEKARGNLEKNQRDRWYTLSANMLIHERLIMYHRQIMEHYDHIRLCADQIRENDRQILKLTLIRNVLEATFSI